MDKFFSGASKGKPGASASTNSNDAPPSSTTDRTEQTSKPPLPKGVILDKDGKPCRSCTSMRDWMAMAKAESSSSPSSTSSTSPTTTTSSSSSSSHRSQPSPSTFSSLSSQDTYPPDCPPDVERLGNHTWTLLHSLTANYPSTATPQQQTDMRTFLGLFAKLYPCWVCAEDFERSMKRPGGEPKVKGRQEFGQWMCEAHNEVNRKLGKDEFDCARWEERWRSGWRDGRCG